MAGYEPGEKIKIVPIFDEEEKNNFLRDAQFEVIGLYVTNNANGKVINIGFPAIASYNAPLGNMYGFKKNNGMYFLAGDFPEINDRPIYIITSTSSYTVDSYSQINVPIIGKHDLLEMLTDEKENDNQIKRAN